MSSRTSQPDPKKTVKVSIQSKYHEYKPSEWKRAILAFLDATWSQFYYETTRRIIFGNISLYLAKDGYHLQVPVDQEKITRPSFDRSEIHAVTSDPDKLELGLARFARNKRIKMLVIEFPAMRLMLWKGDEKTDLHYTVIDRTF